MHLVFFGAKYATINLYVPQVFVVQHMEDNGRLVKS